MELAGGRTNISEMTDRIKELEQQLADQAEATAEAGRRATEEETRVAELGERMEELSAANDERGGTPDRAVAQLEETLQVSEDRVQQLKADLADAEAVHRAAAAEREAWRGQAELERYRSLEEVRVGGRRGSPVCSLVWRHAQPKRRCERNERPPSKRETIPV